MRCPLWVISRHFSTTLRRSAFGGKADISKPACREPHASPPAIARPNKARKSARPSLPARKMETPSITKDKDAEINGDVEARLQQLKRIYEQGLIEK